MPFWKNVFRENAFKVLSCVRSAGSLMRDARHASGKTQNEAEIFFFSCMKPFASYSRRFKINFKPEKTDFLKNLHWCCPLNIIALICAINVTTGNLSLFFKWNFCVELCLLFHQPLSRTSKTTETIFVIFVQIHILNRIGNLVVKQQKNFYEQKTLNCNEWDTLL